MLIFLGYGDGRAWTLFKQNRSSIHRAICIIETRPEKVLAAIERDHLKQDLNNPSIQWILESDESQILACLYDFFYRNTVFDRHLIVLTTPSLLQETPEVYQRIVEEIPLLRDQVVLSHGDTPSDHLHGLRNTVQNREDILRNEAWASWDQTTSGGTCVSVASGPSLEESIPSLRKISETCTVIASASALRYVLQQGVRVDFVCAIERSDDVAECFEGLKIPPDLRLICPVVMSPKAVKAFQGQKIFYAPLPRIHDLLGTSRLGRLLPGHSSGNLNVMAAARMGFSRVILVGHDLCFSPIDGRSHFQGIGDERGGPQDLQGLRDLVSVPRADGSGVVAADSYYQLFRKELEVGIGKFPEIEFISCAKKGAKIRGAHLQNLAELESELLKQDRQVVSFRAHEFNLRDQEEKLSSSLQNLKDWIVRVHRDRDSLAKTKDSKITQSLRMDMAKDEVFKTSGRSLLHSAWVLFEREAHAYELEGRNDLLVTSASSFLDQAITYLPLLLTELQKWRDGENHLSASSGAHSKSEI